MTQADVSEPGIEHRAMSRDGEWDLLDALKSGTRAMRTQQFLPINPRESAKAYDYRSANSYLFPGFKSALDTLTALPFAKPVTVTSGGSLHPALERLETDCDREGTRLHDFMHMCDEEAGTYGLVHVLVDYPSQRSTPNQLEEKVGDVRPYFVMVSPRSLIRWRSARNAAGKHERTGVAIYEKRVEPDPTTQYADVEVEYVREVTKTDWRMWRKPVGASEYVIESEGVHTFGVIPLVTVYYDQTGDMTACPPLLDLAWTNLRHFNSESTQEVALNFARLPILFGRGFSKEEAANFGKVGPGSVMFAADASAQLSSVEHTGASIDAGRQHGVDLIEQMVSMGAQPLIEQTSATATGESRQDKRATSKRQEWCNALQNGMIAAYKLAAHALGAELPEKFAVNLNGDFVLSAQAALHLQALQVARNTGDLSHGTYIAELKKRGVLGANVDAEAEREAAAQEGGALSEVGTDDEAPAEEPEEEEAEEPEETGPKAA
jgi:hypothetical protein